MKRFLCSLFLTCSCLGSVLAGDFVVIGHDTNVFDSANASGYMTTNSKGAEVKLLPGMAFRKSDCRVQGWNMVEYSPGLRGYVMQTSMATAARVKLPSAGVFPVANDPGKTAEIKNNGGAWTATVGGNIYQGKADGNVIVFTDKSGNVAYSAMALDSKTVVMSYSNDVTGYF